MALSQDCLDYLRNRGKAGHTGALVPKLFIHENLYHSSNKTDVSDRVLRWGVVTGESTMIGYEWRIPGMNVLLRNTDGYFSANNTASYWTSVNRTWKQVAVEFALYFHKEGKTDELVKTLLCHLADIVYKFDGNLASVEFIMLAHQNYGMSRYLDRDLKWDTVPGGAW